MPVQTFVACRKDAHRKPEAGMWALLESERFNGGVIVDRAQSFYVGDAAGRPGDHSDSDAKVNMPGGSGQRERHPRGTMAPVSTTGV